MRDEDGRLCDDGVDEDVDGHSAAWVGLATTVSVHRPEGQGGGTNLSSRLLRLRTARVSPLSVRLGRVASPLPSALPAFAPELASPRSEPPVDDCSFEPVSAAPVAFATPTASVGIMAHTIREPPR